MRDLKTHRHFALVTLLCSLTALSACAQNNIPSTSSNASAPNAHTASARADVAKTAPPENLFVAYGINTGAVAAFKPPYTGSPFANMLGLDFPLDIAMDSHHDLFVADPYSSLTMWKPPYRTESILKGSGYGAVLVGSDNELFAADTSGGFDGIDILKPPYKNVSGEIYDEYSNYPTALAMDSKHGLFVVNQLGGNVAYYPPPYKHASVAFTNLGLNPGAQTIAVDGRGTLFVIASETIHVYKRPYKPNTFQTIANGIADPQAIAVTPSGDLFVANDVYTASGYGNVTIYKPPYAAPLETISGTPVDDPQSVAVTKQGNLFIGNKSPSGTGFVSAFKPPYAKPYATISRGISGGVNYVFLGP